MGADPQELALQSNRKVCHKARDEYFRCMDETGEDEKKCRVFHKIFKDSCPDSWVNHFTRKRKYEVYKKAADKMELAALDERYTDAGK